MDVVVESKLGWNHRAFLTRNNDKKSPKSDKFSHISSLLINLN